MGANCQQAAVVEKIDDAPAKMEPPKKVVYFAYNCKCNVPPTICLDIAKIPYEVEQIDFVKDWLMGTAKQSAPTGTLPYIVLKDGTKVGESFTCKMTCASAAGLLGTGKEYVISSLLMTLMEELWQGSAKFSMQRKDGPSFPSLANAPPPYGGAPAWTKEQIEGAKGLIPEIKTFFEKMIEPYLLPSGDKFTSTGITVGEIELWHRLDMLKNGPAPDLVQSTKLQKFYDRMEAVPEIKNFKDGKSKWGQLINFYLPFSAVES